MEQDAVTATPVVGSNKQHSGKGWRIATIVASVVAICGIGFGVYGIFFYKTGEPISDNNETIPETQEDVSITEKNLPSVETINSLLREKYKLFDQDNFTANAGTILSDYAYNEDGEGLGEAGKLFLIVREEYPNPNCNDTVCYRTVTYKDLNDKYHEYFSNSANINKGVDYTNKHIFIGVDSIKYKEDDSFEITYPNAIGGTLPSIGYYTNIVDTERNSDGDIVAMAIVTKVDAENAKLYGTAGCLEAFECPYINMKTIKVGSSLYRYVFVEEDGIYKLTDIVKR